MTPKEKAIKSPVTKKLNKVLTDAVDLEEEHTILLHHEYDGIRELDNNLPPWWVWGFYATIVFAVVYVFHFHILGTGDLQNTAYEKEMIAKQKEVEAYLVKMAMNVDETSAELRGRDLVTGLPRTIVVTAEEIRRALDEPLTRIVDAVKTTLDRTPPELCGDIMDRGIVLTGGGALLKGLDERLRHETGMPVIIAEQPLNCVVMGSGKCVEEFEALQQVLISEPRG